MDNLPICKDETAFPEGRCSDCLRKSYSWEATSHWLSRSDFTSIFRSSYNNHAGSPVECTFLQKIKHNIDRSFISHERD